MPSAKHRYKAQRDQETVLESSRNPPTSRPVAVYYRQSTFAQVGNISTQLQTIDMVEELKRRGWKPNDIILIDMDAGVSGTKKINDRAGMRYLFELISEGQIGAVACEDEDRLFRDVTQIQVNIFIEACRISNVLVLTPSMIYDFANEQLGTFHARQFRFKSELAAEYINTFVKAKLLRAKRRLAMEGRWFGGRLPPGFMFDTRKHLPDGTPNPNWRKYVPFEPYADVVNEYFRLFLSYAGNLNATERHIQQRGPYYPDPATCPPPAGFRVVYPFKRFKNGFCPGMTSLMHLLTNAVYIGHWMVNDTVAIYNNHPRIVPEKVFWEAFNYLSRVSLDGSVNPTYRPFLEQARPTLEAERGVERPLYAGLLYWQYGGQWLRLGTSWVGTKKHYAYQATSPEQFDGYEWRRTAQYVDEAISDLLRERIRATFDEQVWQDTLNTFSSGFEKERKRLQSQLDALERFMDNQIASLDVITNPQLIKAVEQRYAEAQNEHKRLTDELSHAADEVRNYRQWQNYVIRVYPH
jgi:DNA invertase Pin-like site-specific DNA recombinase